MANPSLFLRILIIAWCGGAFYAAVWGNPTRHLGDAGIYALVLCGNAPSFPIPASTRVNLLLGPWRFRTVPAVWWPATRENTPKNTEIDDSG
jgi:hypothetical protein